MTDDDFLRSWTSDARGDRVLVGLTIEETAEYQEINVRRLLGRARGEDGERYLHLFEKHESSKARLLPNNRRLRRDRRGER